MPLAATTQNKELIITSFSNLQHVRLGLGHLRDSQYKLEPSRLKHMLTTRHESMYLTAARHHARSFSAVVVFFVFAGHRHGSIAPTACVICHPVRGGTLAVSSRLSYHRGERHRVKIFVCSGLVSEEEPIASESPSSSRVHV